MKRRDKQLINKIKPLYPVLMTGIVEKLEKEEVAA